MLAIIGVLACDPIVVAVTALFLGRLAEILQQRTSTGNRGCSAYAPSISTRVALDPTPIANQVDGLVDGDR